MNIMFYRVGKGEGVKTLPWAVTDTASRNTCRILSHLAFLHGTLVYRDKCILNKGW